MELSGLPRLDKKMRKKHVDDIKKDVVTKRKKINAGVCPKCNSVLVERIGPYGRFWGCSNYPKCNFTQKNNSHKSYEKNKNHSDAYGSLRRPYGEI